MDKFVMNGYLWHVIRVPPDSDYLVDRTGVKTVATTDPNTLCIYIDDSLNGTFAKRVIAHEMGHAVCFSYDLLNEIHRCCYPEHMIDMEEFICNFVSDYGEQIFELTYQIAGEDALAYVPYYLERMIA